MSATLILGGAGALIGSSIGGPSGARLGWSIGATVGGLVDAMNIKNPPVGKLTDLRYSGSSYGVVYPRGWGKNRYGGNIFWVQNLVKNKTAVPSFALDYTMRVSENAALHATTLHVDPLPFGLPISTDIQFYSGWTTTLTSAANAGDTLVHVTSLPNAIFTGDTARVSGATHLVEHVKSSSAGGGSGGGGSSTTYTYSATFAVALMEGTLMMSDGSFSHRFPVFSKIWADEKLIYDVNNPAGNKVNITFYTGTETQNPDPTMVATEGSTYCPAYRGVVYCVFANMDLSVFGNRIPNISAEIQTNPVNVGDIGNDLLGQVGLNGYKNLTQATASVTGYTVSTRMAVRDQINPLLQSYVTDQVEVEGEIRWIPRGGSVVANIGADDVGWALDGNSVTDLTRQFAAKKDLPGRVDFSFYDVNNNYANNTRSDVKQDTSLTGAISINSQLSLTSDEARQFAARLMDIAYLEDAPFVFSIPTKLIWLIPTDIINLEDNGKTYRTRILSMEIGEPGEIRCQAVVDQIWVLDQVASTGGTVSGGGTTSNTVPVPTIFTLYSGKELRTEDQQFPGFYVAGTGLTGWTGADIYYSTDSGTTWIQCGRLSARSIFGTTTSVLADGSGALYWDNTHTLGVSLTDDNLAVLGSVTADAVLGGQNIAIVGSEILGFQNATLTADNPPRYTLANLYRGIRGSSFTGHSSPEKFILATTSVVRINVPSGLVGTTIKVKCVSALQTLADCTSQDILIAARTPTDIETIVTGDQIANTVFAGPISGPDAPAIFRPLVADDLPESATIYLYFGSGFIPGGTGPDNVVLTIPRIKDVVKTFTIKRFTLRVETDSAGTTSARLEVSPGSGAFSATNIMTGGDLSLSGIGTFEVDHIVFSTTTIDSDEKIRLNFTALDVTHADFSGKLELVL